MKRVYVFAGFYGQHNVLKQQFNRSGHGLRVCSNPLSGLFYPAFL